MRKIKTNFLKRIFFAQLRNISILRRPSFNRKDSHSTEISISLRKIIILNLLKASLVTQKILSLFNFFLKRFKKQQVFLNETPNKYEENFVKNLGFNFLQPRRLKRNPMMRFKALFWRLKAILDHFMEAKFFLKPFNSPIKDEKK